MRSTLKFLVALAVAFAAMFLFRALAFTIYSVADASLEPAFFSGDRVVVNRWSYGLRTGGGGLFSYGRLCRQPLAEGDYVAVDDSLGRVFVGRCTALPGDTVPMPDSGARVVVPSRANCDASDGYYVEHIGVVAEERIVGRVVLVLYNRQTGQPFWRGYDAGRFCLLR